MSSNPTEHDSPSSRLEIFLGCFSDIKQTKFLTVTKPNHLATTFKIERGLKHLPQCKLELVFQT